MFFKRQTQKQDMYKKFIWRNILKGVGIDRNRYEPDVWEGRERMGWVGSNSGTQLWKKSKPDQWGIPEQKVNRGILYEVEIGQYYYNTLMFSGIDWDSLGENILVEPMKWNRGLSVSCAPHSAFSSRRCEHYTSMAILFFFFFSFKAILYYILRIHVRTDMNYL